MGWILRSRFRVRLGVFYSVFSFIVAAGVWIALAHKYGSLRGWNLDLFLKWYAAVTVFLAVWFAAKVFSAFFWDFYVVDRRKMRVPGLLRSIVTVLILVAAVLLIVRFVFNLSLSGLLVASSVTAAVIIFALQDFLSGLIAGITLSIEPPFGAGDWVKVGDKEGEVVDINWRATTLQTLDKTYLVIPNSVISKCEIINFDKPTRLHGLTLSLGIESDAPPSLVKETLIACALEAQGVVSMPKPVARLINFGDFAITYELKFYIENHSDFKNIQDDVMTRIWYNLKRKGIKSPFPMLDVFIHESVDKKESLEEKSRVKLEGFLRKVSIFDPLDDEHIKTLADSGRSWSFGKGERIVKQGEIGRSLYLILDGSASVHVRLADNGKEITVGRLQAGDFFGEKSLLTGEPRSADVVADTDLEVIEIEKRDLSPIFEDNPMIVEELSRYLAERQLINEGFFKEERKAEEVAVIRIDYSTKFLKSIKSFFGL